MSNTDIAIRKPSPFEVLMGERSFDRDKKSRLKQFCQWLEASKVSWAEPRLWEYRDYLLQRLTPSSTSAHLSTIRAHYVRLVSENQFRRWTQAQFAAVNPEYTPAEIITMTNEFFSQLLNSVSAENAPVDTIEITDQSDAVRRRLTISQQQALLAAPGLDTLRGVRDTALLALLICTGIREGELVSLSVEDLRQTYAGVLALEVRDGKGSKQRMIPYGAMDWALALTEYWLKAAGITEGPVFRSILKSGLLGQDYLSVKTVERVLNSYPIVVDGELVEVLPHDLRATYARNCWNAGMSEFAIQQNMGHATGKTTQGYIGRLDGEERSPSAIFTFDLSKLI
jgi:site-specific recombinase XerD